MGDALVISCQQGESLHQVDPPVIIHKEHILLIVAPLRNVAGRPPHNDACESSHDQHDNTAARFQPNK